MGLHATSNSIEAVIAASGAGVLSETSYTLAEKATLAQAAIRVNELDASVVLVGEVDLSVDGLPTSTKQGQSWICSNVDEFALPNGRTVNSKDRIVSIVENASTVLDDFDTNWLLLDYSDSVNSINGKRGAVVLDSSDVGALATTGGKVTGALDITGTELVTNGDFFTSPLTDWTADNSILTIESERLRVLSDGAVDGAATYLLPDLVIGATYRLKIDCFFNGADGYLVKVLGLTGLPAQRTRYDSGTLLEDTSLDITFIAKVSETAIKLASFTDNGYAEFDNISVVGIATVDGKKIANVEDSVQKISSTDNAIVRFDGTTGEVQDSGVVIDDNGSMYQDGDTGVAFRQTAKNGYVDNSQCSYNVRALHNRNTYSAYGGTEATPASLNDQDTIYRLTVKGAYIGAGTKNSSLKAFVDGQPDSTSCPIGWKWDVVNRSGSTIEALRIHSNGDVELPTIGQSLIMSSPNGTGYKITVDDSGNLTTTIV